MLLLTTAAATNLLILVADDLGADKVGRFADYTWSTSGGAYLPSTPNLDALADTGLVFTTAWANPLCSPTRASLLTGNFPFHTGVGAPVAANAASGPMLDTDDTTLAEVLGDAGYATAWFGKWHMGSVGSEGTASWDSFVDCEDDETEFEEDPSPILHGFDSFLGFFNGEPTSYSAWHRIEAEGEGEATSCLDTTNYPDDLFVAESADWMNHQHDPFFAVVAFAAPHADGTGTVGEFEYDDLAPGCAALVAEEDACIASGSCADEDGDGQTDDQDLVFRYLVECLDAQIGTLFASLDADVLADTLVVFMGDNGTPGNQQMGSDLLEDPYTRSVSAATGEGRWGKASAFNSGVRVPFIVAGTDIRSPGHEITRPILVEDVFDTALDALGVSYAGETDGASFADCFSSTLSSCGVSTPDERPVYAETFSLDGGGALTVGRAALRGSRYKLVLEYSRPDGCMYPSAYAVSDDLDETDLYTSLSTLQVAPLKRVIHHLGADWLPTAESGLVTFCR